METTYQLLLASAKLPSKKKEIQASSPGTLPENHGTGLKILYLFYFLNLEIMAQVIAQASLELSHFASGFLVYILGLCRQPG